MEEGNGKGEEGFFKKHLALIALLVAIVGGAPGILTIFNYFNSPKLTDIRINFNSTQSFCAFISSNDYSINSKLAVLLFQVTLAGKGQIPSYPHTMALYVKYKGTWLLGRQFRPMRHSASEQRQFGAKMEHPSDTSRQGLVSFYRMGINHGIPQVDFLQINGWTDFTLSDKGIAYGEPETISYAASFEISYDDYNSCDGLKIEIEDHLGNHYELIQGPEFFNPRFQYYVLCQQELLKCDGAIEENIKQMLKTRHSKS